MAVVQRSITFPPIKIVKIDEYVTYVAKNRATVVELKEKIDIGRGRGDITRFLERIGVVEAKDYVVLTELGRELVSTREAIGNAVYHALFYQRVPQYRLLIEAAREGAATQDQLHQATNRRLSEISPTAWLNTVAFKTLLHMAENLEAIEKRDGRYIYLNDPVERAVERYYATYGVKIGDSFYATFDKILVLDCGRQELPHGLYKIDVACVTSKIYHKFQ